MKSGNVLSKLTYTNVIADFYNLSENCNWGIKHYYVEGKHDSN